jgi:hypothetical protein
VPDFAEELEVCHRHASDGIKCRDEVARLEIERAD